VKPERPGLYRADPEQPGRSSTDPAPAAPDLENTFLLCYLRGPAGIIVALAEQIG
jgi:hypothetical protein